MITKICSIVVKAVCRPKRCELAPNCAYYNSDPQSQCQVDGSYFDKPFCGIHKKTLYHTHTKSEANTPTSTLNSVKTYEVQNS
jgi:hypothetical protein